MLFLKLTERKLIFAYFVTLTRLTKGTLEAQRNETHFCLFSETHKTHKQSSLSSQKRNSFCLFSKTHKTHKQNLWVSENKQILVSSLWASRPTFVSLVSLREQAKMSLVSLSFKSSVCESCESQKTSKNEFSFSELQEFHLWVLWVSENKQKCVSFLWASRVPFESLVSVTK